MTKPAQILILDEVQARLKNIKAANGYRRTVAGVRRATLTTFQSADLPMVNFWAGTDDAVNRGAGFVDRQMALIIEIYDLTRDRPFVDVVFEMADDVAIALHRATTAPTVAANPEQRFGGLLTTLRLAGITPQIGEGQAPWCGALVTFDALYKVRTNGTLITA